MTRFINLLIIIIYGIKRISKTMKGTKISTVHGQPIPDVNNSFTKEMNLLETIILIADNRIFFMDMY